MKRFLEFVDPQYRKYVALEVEEKSRIALQDWATFLGFDTKTGYDGNPTDKMDYHITVFYSENTSSIAERFDTIPAFIVNPVGVDLLGEKQDIPVLIIEPNGDLMKIYEDFENQGLETKWPEWKIHISLSYKYDGNPDIKTVPLPPFPIVINKLKVENIKETE